MKMKMTNLLVLFGATSALLTISISMQASETDDRIESSAAKSYVFKTYLRTIPSKPSPKTAW